jgi:C-terminal processing protease CtpA/Prc
MNKWKLILAAAAVLLFAGQTLAQQEVTEAAEVKRTQELREAEYVARLREAEERMEQAARQIAEISRERLPQMVQMERRFAFSDKPMIGITIESNDESEAVEGVHVEGVTPGSAADDAGMRAGDIITAVNGETLAAGSSAEANKLLFDFMSGIEEGDMLTIEYLRNGNAGKVDLAPRVAESSAFAWMSDAPNIHVGRIPGAPNVVREFRFDGGFPWGSSGLGSMELVALNPGLGKYFGTDTGLLVVSAPESEAFKLEDGDVIQNIDGREPKDVRQALKILGTYEAGETVKLGIMREKKKRTLEIEIPESDYRGMRVEPLPPAPISPARVPMPPRARPPVDVST